MIQLFTALFLFCHQLASPTTLHDLHLSKCLIEYNTQAQALQVTLFIYLDDLEADIEREDGHTNLKLCTKKEAPEGENYMETYIRRHLRMIVDGEEQTYNFLGKEPSDDYQAAWCYLEIEGVEDVKELTIENDILIQLFADQQNVLEIKKDRKRKGFFLLDRKATTQKVDF